MSVTKRYHQIPGTTHIVPFSCLLNEIISKREDLQFLKCIKITNSFDSIVSQAQISKVD